MLYGVAHKVKLLVLVRLQITGHLDIGGFVIVDSSAKKNSSGLAKHASDEGKARKESPLSTTCAKLKKEKRQVVGR